MTDPAPRAAGDLPDGGVAVPGEVVTIEAVQPSAEQIEASKERAKSRSGQQAFSAGAVVTIAVWLLRLAGIDLNPMADSEEIPNEVVAAWTALMTYAAAVWMNR